LGSGQSHRQRKQQSGQMDQGGDTYQEGTRQVDEQRRGVFNSLTSTTTCSPRIWEANGD